MEKITYRQEGDYLVPNLTLPKENLSIGKYGRMRERYLKENRRGLYTSLLMTGRLQKHLWEINQTAQERIDLMVSRMAEKNRVNEEMKAQDQMKWVGLMNSFKQQAEEIVLAEIVLS